jgi:hypothetical protein
MDQIIPEAQLPIRMAAFGHCFRTEAGAAGGAPRIVLRAGWHGNWLGIPFHFVASPRLMHAFSIKHFQLQQPGRVPPYCIVGISRHLDIPCHLRGQGVLSRPRVIGSCLPARPPGLSAKLPDCLPAHLAWRVRAGSASRGLYRVHQFSKVEMFVVCTPEQSDALHRDLIELETEMFEELGLHFKVGVVGVFAFLWLDAGGHKVEAAPQGTSRWVWCGGVFV